MIQTFAGIMMGAMIVVGVIYTIFAFRRRAARRQARLKVWQAAAERFGGTIEKVGVVRKTVREVNGLWIQLTGHALSVELSKVLVRAETYALETADGVGTRFIAWRTVDGGPDFVISPRGRLSGKGAPLGDEEFDRHFVTRTKEPEAVAKIVTATIRERLLSSFANFSVRGNATHVSLSVIKPVADPDVLDLALETTAQLASEPRQNLDTLTNLPDADLIEPEGHWESRSQPMASLNTAGTTVTLRSTFNRAGFGVLAATNKLRPIDSFKVTTDSRHSWPDGALCPEAAALVDGLGDFEVTCDGSEVRVYLNGWPNQTRILDGARLAGLVAVGGAAKGRH